MMMMMGSIYGGDGLGRSLRDRLNVTEQSGGRLVGTVWRDEAFRLDWRTVRIRAG